MSLYSGRSLTSSILKRTKTIQERLKSAPSSSKVRFVLPHSQNVRKIFKDFLKRDNTKDYQQLICMIRDAELTDDDLSNLLQESNECISMMNNDLRLFVEVLLTIQWTNRDSKLVKEYQSFLGNLLVAHPCHAKHVIDHLVSLFLPGLNEEVWESGEPSPEDAKKFSHVHKVLKTLLKTLPLCLAEVRKSLQDHYPYFKRGVHINDCYLYNLLRVVEYAPNMKMEILDLIFVQLTKMDCSITREMVKNAYSDDDEDEEMFAVDEIQSSVLSKSDSNKILVETLDVCLRRIFKFIHKECINAETGDPDSSKIKNFYKNTLVTFDGIILRTHDTHYIQFCWFVLLGLKPCLAETFIEHLWQKVTTPSVHPEDRQASVQYIASLVARASYVNIRLLKNVLQQMSLWIQSYINAQNDVESININLKVHSVFYSTCQALFYVTFFRHKEIISTDQNLSFLGSLNFSKIVNCRLNPLRVCQPAVAQNFDAFARNYQLAYCHVIIERNSRSRLPTKYQKSSGPGMAQTNDVLEATYPFDPYDLKKGSDYIKPHYRVYKEIDLKQKPENNEDEEDDFIDEAHISSKRMKFSYGSSPGFQFSMCEK